MLRPQSKRKIIIGAVVGFCVAQDLCQCVRAQRVGVDFINNGRNYQGSQMQFRSPEGYTCNFENSDRPSINFGVGIADPQIIPSSYSYDRVYPAYAREREPVGGVVVRVPFGSQPKNCDEILSLEADKLGLESAQRLFENGLIEEEQLKKVADKVYDNILKSVND